MKSKYQIVVDIRIDGKLSRQAVYHAADSKELRTLVETFVALKWDVINLMEE